MQVTPLFVVGLVVAHLGRGKALAVEVGNTQRLLAAFLTPPVLPVVEGGVVKGAIFIRAEQATITVELAVGVLVATAASVMEQQRTTQALVVVEHWVTAPPASIKVQQQRAGS